MIRVDQSAHRECRPLIRGSNIALSRQLFLCGYNMIIFLTQKMHLIKQDIFMGK
jgi:hypothetical protein